MAMVESLQADIGHYEKVIRDTRKQILRLAGEDPKAAWELHEDYIVSLMENILFCQKTIERLQRQLTVELEKRGADTDPAPRSRPS
jgi:hypothetical protein